MIVTRLVVSEGISDKLTSISSSSHQYSTSAIIFKWSGHFENSNNLLLIRSLVRTLVIIKNVSINFQKVGKQELDIKE